MSRGIPYRVAGPVGAAWYAASREFAFRTRDAYRKRLVTEDVSVICANCWGAEVYRHLAIPYNTPFVGLIIHAPCWMRLLRDLPGYLDAPFEWVERSTYEKVDTLRQQGLRPMYPIGVLRGDVEIHFLHHPSVQEAESKWRRRTERMNWSNLRVAFLEWGPLEAEAAPVFDQLEYEKVMLTPEARPDVRCALQVRANYANGAAAYYHSLWQFDVVEWLNSGAVVRHLGPGVGWPGAAVDLARSVKRPST